MNMKDHILAALREMFDRWDILLRGMNEEQLTIPLPPSRLSFKDEIAHLWAWQQRSIARLEAALLDHEPVFPKWLAESDPELLDNTDQTNAWIYETYRELPWLEVQRNWKDGFKRFLEFAERIPERDLLDSSKYPWLDGYALAHILLASYDHHQEHIEKLQSRLGAGG